MTFVPFPPKVLFWSVRTGTKIFGGLVLKNLNLLDLFAHYCSPSKIKKALSFKVTYQEKFGSRIKEKYPYENSRVIIAKILLQTFFHPILILKSVLPYHGCLRSSSN